MPTLTPTHADLLAAFQANNWTPGLHNFHGGGSWTRPRSDGGQDQIRVKFNRRGAIIQANLMEIYPGVVRGSWGRQVQALGPKAAGKLATVLGWITEDPK